LLDKVLVGEDERRSVTFGSKNYSDVSVKCFSSESLHSTMFRCVVKRKSREELKCERQICCWEHRSHNTASWH